MDRNCGEQLTSAQEGDISLWYAGHPKYPVSATFRNNGYAYQQCYTNPDYCDDPCYTCDVSARHCGPYTVTAYVDPGNQPLTLADVPQLSCNEGGGGSCRPGEVFAYQVVLQDANGQSTNPYCFTLNCGPLSGIDVCWRMNPTPCYCEPGPGSPTFACKPNDGTPR